MSRALQYTRALTQSSYENIFGYATLSVRDDSSCDRPEIPRNSSSRRSDHEWKKKLAIDVIECEPDFFINRSTCEDFMCEKMSPAYKLFHCCCLDSEKNLIEFFTVFIFAKLSHFGVKRFASSHLIWLWLTDMMSPGRRQRMPKWDFAKLLGFYLITSEIPGTFVNYQNLR